MNTVDVHRSTPSEFSYWDPIAGLVAPLFTVCFAGLGVLINGFAWFALTAPILLAIIWLILAQRVEVSSSSVRAFYAPLRRFGVTIPRSEVRLRYDAFGLYLDRLDGLPIGRYRRRVIVACMTISGPPSVVYDLRRAGMHVERV